jgi:hypothetical protein
MNRCAQFVCFFALLVLGTAVHAQVLNSGAQTIALNAILGESMSVNLSSHAVNFTLVAGSATNNGSTGVTAITSWISRPGRTVSVYAYFSSSTAALSNGLGDNIPSSDFLISDNGGAYRALTNNVAFGAANAGLRLYRARLNGATRRGTHTDNMLFRINLSTLPQLPAGTYTGTLNIQAQAI